MRKQYAVIGLGRFGSSICKELYQLGHDVLAIDINKERVINIEKYATYAVNADGTDEDALKSLGIRNFEKVIVTIGANIQPSILCTLILKELGVKEVWVKAHDQKHVRILESIGADRIIQPEYEMGIRIAHQLDSSRVIEYVELSKDHSIVELEATKKNDNKSLKQLDIRAKYGCTILAIKRGEEVVVSPSPDEKISEGDLLVAIGHKVDLVRFQEKGM
ncbi:TrkA family potassium uptake protein [Oceanobacillus piezotolerans]|uniref:TrkA family potassium uptake protein n=1 Tax=Oceanobacillus piezotolerans TaxID=2448030 RepID=A0A498D7F3_9BACI|nr:TrkA family potassium uptake protein [Oceanobacillus piezotolerans]RLL43954.1 TrkA family potassium uptake protein [Oceanobacillus piezotolerans]